jgi:Ser/Thr protein kinase RdoA (MazF antagonist)
VQAQLVSRAIAAATSIVGARDLPVDNAVVLHNSNKLALRLLPCGVFGRVALIGEEVAALEVDLAQRLTALDAPVAALDPRVEPRVYERDGFALTFWTYYAAAVREPGPPAEYAASLRHLHAAMRRVDVAAPHFTERAAEAEQLVADRNATPALAEADRQLLLSTLHIARQRIHAEGAGEQLLHGEPHPGNLISAHDGPRFIDFETCCRGPVEFDIAHVPGEVSAHYPGVDGLLLDECRRLVLAMVAAWRWDVRDEFPNGHHHGRNIVALLRDGPPWPTLDALASE